MLATYTRLKHLFFLCLLALFSQGCNIINPPEQTPTYVHIDSFGQFTNPFPGVSSSHQISVIWVYYNNGSVGVFDLPVTFPVLTNGNDSGTLEVAPGVTLDGLNDLLATDPFYEIATTTLISQPGKIINYTPATGFYPADKIMTLSNFEGLTNFTLTGGNIPITIVNADSLVFEGHYSGSILLSSPGDSSVDSFNAPFAITPGNAFIEFNYKSTLPFYVGMQSNQAGISTSPYYLAGIYPSGTWQKFYLGITDYIAQFPGTTYNFYIKTTLPDTQSTGRLLLDNIQLLHF